MSLPTTINSCYGRHFSDTGAGPSCGSARRADTLWAQLYSEEEARLKAALVPALLGLEHGGSTSIAGIKAKPILDILAGIGCLGDASRLAAPLSTLGYEDAGIDIVPGHHIFAKGAARTHLLHVVEYQSAIWMEALKVRLSKQYADSRADYTASKAAFIQSVLDRN